MRVRPLSANNRRLRWALAIALALHAILLWQYAPQFLSRFDGAQLLPVSAPVPQPVEQVIEITPPAPPPRQRGIELATRLGGASPEALAPELPPDFFPKPTPLGGGRLNLSSDLDFARASGAQIVANIIPAATRMADLSLVDGRVRRLKPKAIRPLPSPPPRTTALAPIAQVAVSAPAKAVVDVAAIAEAPVPIQSATLQQPLRARAAPAQAALLDAPQLSADAPPQQPQIQLQPQPPLEEPSVLSEDSFVPEDDTAVPFLLPPPPPPVVEDLNVDAAIEQAARTATQSARVANSSSQRAAPDYRSMLPQGPLVAAPPLPLGGDRVTAAAPRESSITTYALEAPAARAPAPPTAEQQRAAAAARQQFFAQLTARLKATNQRLLAEALKAGPRTTVQMRFLINREGRVIEMGPVEPGNRLLVERAMAVIRAASLPRVPDSMTQVPVELSFPVEVYR